MKCKFLSIVQISFHICGSTRKSNVSFLLSIMLYAHFQKVQDNISFFSHL
jgi:hypothetical protein